LDTFSGKCWPDGKSSWIDYLNEDARNAWASFYSYEKHKYSTKSLGIWNDMNEPSVFDVDNLSMNNDFKQSFINKNKELVYVPHG
jgi:alpha-glucosidase (family GH31 glycosyl hydrolase)